jgi:hypothetical protein
MNCMAQIFFFFFVKFGKKSFNSENVFNLLKQQISWSNHNGPKLFHPRIQLQLSETIQLSKKLICNSLKLKLSHRV